MATLEEEAAMPASNGTAADAGAVGDTFTKFSEDEKTTDQSLEEAQNDAKIKESAAAPEGGSLLTAESKDKAAMESVPAQETGTTAEIKAVNGDLTLHTAEEAQKRESAPTQESGTKDGGAGVPQSETKSNEQGKFRTRGRGGFSRGHSQRSYKANVKFDPSSLEISSDPDEIRRQVGRCFLWL